MERNSHQYERCNQCVHFKKEGAGHRYYSRAKYDCEKNPNHKARPNRKACEFFDNKYKAKSGDWCEYNNVTITNVPGTNVMRPCNACLIRCVFASDKTERDYRKKGE